VDPLSLQIDRAEALFADGRTDAARTLLEELAAVAAEPPLLSRILNDLGVIAAGAGDGAQARALIGRALDADPANADALENLADLCRVEGDAAQAAHWLRRALALEPGREAARAALVDALEATHDWAQADAARAAGVRAGDRPRVLLLPFAFHPSRGGTETLAEQAALALRERGWDVEVGTEPHPERTEATHRGFRVHELPDDGGASLRALLAERHFDAVLSFAAPLGWPIIFPPTFAQPRPRIVLVPCVNLDGYRQVSASPERRAGYAGVVRQADVVVHSSLHGWDARLARELGLRTAYVPNAAARVEPARPPRAPDGTARLLAVGNLWEEKNHVGLLEALRGRPGDWTLRIIGGPPKEGQPSPEPLLRALAAEDDRIRLTGPADAGEVAAAMRESDLLLLPSRVEATPLVLVEAMSHGLPWVATPTCGSAGDHAGGLIAPLERFPDVIDWLIEEPAARRELGGAGLAHYEANYTWDVVGARFDALLSGDAALPDATVPPDAAEATAAVRERYSEALLARAATPALARA
jgi:O-antigen biosynthesis protein